MGIFKALYLIPELVCLSGAVAADVRCRGRGVNAFSVLKNRYKQLAQMVIRDGFALPSVLRIKDFERLCFVNRFVIDAKQVGNGFAAVVVIDSVYFFIVRVCDFSRILADFDFRLDDAILFRGHELIYASENRVAFGGDEAFADAESVDFRSLADDVADDIFIERIGYDDFTFRQALADERGADFLCEIGDIAGIDAHAEIPDALRHKNLLKCANRVRQSAFHDVVGVDQQGRIVRINPAVRFKGFIFAVEHLHP